MNKTKTILITGGAKRIGAAISQYFSLKNWNIIIHYNTSEKSALDLSNKINSCGGNSSIIKADLRNELDIINMFEFATKKYNKLDVLVNNAGFFPERKPIVETELGFWDNILNTNLRSHFITSREFAKYVTHELQKNSIENLTNKEEKFYNSYDYSYKIINIASLGGLKYWKERASYSVSKSAAIHLSKSLARELAPNISVNCICPGLIKLEENEILELPETAVPMQRYASSEEIAETVFYFATCSQYITGQVIVVDGGLQLT